MAPHSRRRLFWYFDFVLISIYRQVGPTYVIKFPVMTEDPERTLPVPADGVIAGMVNRPYTLGFWYALRMVWVCEQDCNSFMLSQQRRTNYDTLTVRTVKPASLVNIAGHIVAPGPASFISAMNDFADDPSATVLFLGNLLPRMPALAPSQLPRSATTISDHFLTLLI